MFAQDKEYQKIHRSALIASIILHALLISLFLYLYQKNSSDFASKKPAQIIFMPDEQVKIEEEKKKEQLLDEWATTKPTFIDASSSAHSMQEMISPPIPYEEPKPEAKEQEEEEAVVEEEKTPEHFESLAETKIPVKKVQPKAKVSPKKKKAKPSPKESTQTPTFSQLVKGFSNFIEQTKHGIESRIHMVGKDGKKPTDQQLKYERYLERLVLCLESSLRINRGKSRTPPKRNPRVYMALNRRGILIKFHIIESSGSRDVDEQVSQAFYDAGNSFPPVPDYLPGDPFVTTFVVLMYSNW